MLTLTQTPMLRPFRASDVTTIVNRDGTQVEASQLLKQAALGPAFTACVDERPIAMAGVVLLWPGVGVAWMVLSEDIAPYGRWLTKTVKIFLDDMTQRHHLHRIEAVALQESVRNQVWLEALGFTSEQHGVAQHYLTDHRAVIRYERVGG